MAETKKSTGMVTHLILYAKGQYGSTPSVLTDIRAVIERFCGIHRASDSIVWEALAHASAFALQHVSVDTTREFMLRVLQKDWLGFNENFNTSPEEAIVGLLRFLEIEYVDIDALDTDWMVPPCVVRDANGQETPDV